MSDRSTPGTRPPEQLREVRYEHSRDFVGLLQELGICLLVSTYQAGKLVVLGTSMRGLSLSFHNLPQAMGIGVRADRWAVGSENAIWFLHSAPQIAKQVEPAGQYDACFVARGCHVTDQIDVHEMGWAGETLWFVNTKFSCLCTLHPDYSFVPRWKPRFISSYAAEDRCHLNGLALEGDRPLYVTAMAETDTAGGWRPLKATDGCLVHVPSNETIAKGFAMPHSPRVHGGRLWVLDSGRGQLVTVDPASGKPTTVSQQPGYARGLAFHGPYAFIGLSKIRETSTFGGVPIAQQRDELKCAVAIVDLRLGRRVAYFEFLSGVDEIFDVQILPGIRSPRVAGPFNPSDGHDNIWLVPDPEECVSFAAGGGQLPTVNEIAPQSDVGAEEGKANAFYNRGNALMSQDELDEAIGCFQAALELTPHFAPAHCNLGVALQFLGRLEQSLAALRYAIEIQPEMAAAHFNLAMTLFLLGAWEEAWREYEWRWQCDKFPDRPVVIDRLAPRWNGESLAGKTILIYGEQGIGDEIMFAGCFHDIVRDAKRCVIACEHRLVDLFQRSFDQAQVIALSSVEPSALTEELQGIDCQVASGSIPGLIQKTAGDFPDRDRYLITDPALRSVWSERLEELGAGLKVGISWRGGTGTAEARRRSIELEQWKPILVIPEVQFVNVQYGKRADELQRIRQQLGIEVHELPEIDPLVELDGLAALIANLDLVISIDNSTVHLSGSLGVPTWVLMSFPSASCWRWKRKGERTVWYPSVRLFRKGRTEDWRPMIQNVANQLCVYQSKAKQHRDG